MKVENAIEKGSIPLDYITKEQEKQALSRWSDEFRQENHPAIVQVCLNIYVIKFVGKLI